MNLRRNFLTIIYSAIFIAIMALGMFQILNVTITTAASKYLIAATIVLGLIIYMILAFLCKEGNYLRSFEKNKAILVIAECIVAVGCTGLLFVIRSIDSLNIAILHSALLLCIYLTGRMLFGRLNGILTVGIALTVLLLMENILPLNSDNTLALLCLFIPYLVFMGVNQFIVKSATQNGFLIIMSYLVMGFIFSIAIAMNPLAVLLFLGCVFSLIFASPQGEHSMLAKGFFCAGFLALFTIGLLFVAYLLMPELLEMPSLELDSGVPVSGLDLGIISFIADKFDKPLNYLHLAFSNGVIPTILVFFAILPGYYCISKKASYMGPLLFSFVGLFAYYILFRQTGSEFHYLTYMLPVFTAYGLSNTLISDKKEDEAEEAPEDLADDISDTETEDHVAENKVPENTSSEEAVPEDLVLEEAIPEEEAMPEESMPEDIVPEQAVPKERTASNKSAAEEVTPEEIFVEENAQEELVIPPAETPSSAEPENKAGIAKIPLLGKKQDQEVPEWIMPEEFMETADETEDESADESADEIFDETPDEPILEPPSEEAEIAQATLDMPENIIQADESESTLELESADTDLQTDEPELTLELEEADTDLQKDEPELTLEPEDSDTDLQTDEPELTLELEDADTDLQIDEPELTLELEDADTDLQTDEPELTLELEDADAPLQTDEPELTLELEDADTGLQTDEPELTLELEDADTPLQTDEPEETNTIPQMEETDEPEFTLKLEETNIISPFEETDSNSELDAANIVSRSHELELTPQLDLEPELVSRLEETDSTLGPGNYQDDLMSEGPAIAPKIEEATNAKKTDKVKETMEIEETMETKKNMETEDPKKSEEIDDFEDLIDFGNYGSFGKIGGVEETADVEIDLVPIDFENTLEPNNIKVESKPEEPQPIAGGDNMLDDLLDRLDISDHIRRMNESAREDMADVIEREEEQIELDEALPLKPSNSTLPKYKKPNFGFDVPPINIPLDDTYSNISEYDEVPTIHELESRWKAEDSGVVETIDADILTEELVDEDEAATREAPTPQVTVSPAPQVTVSSAPQVVVSDTTKPETVHSEEIVKKSGTGKRSYHRITIR